MKYLVTLLMLFLTSNVFAQFNIAPHTHRVELGDDIIIEYNADYQQPVRAIYEITCPTGDVDRGGMDFYVPKGINFHTSDDDDYVNNTWDKGHLAPAAAFSCTEEELKTTFSYLNSALQHEGLNRGTWSRLEAFERNLAVFYPDLLVEIHVLFDEGVKELPTGALVPTGFRKILFFDGNSHVFEFPNESTTGTDFMDYLIKEDN
jgi:DNA/RNA endonuclease G (NUC1)